MANRKTELFDYEGFLQEVEEARIKYMYSKAELCRAAGVDHNTLFNVYVKKTLGFPTAASLSAVLNVSIDKYVRAL